MSIPASTPTSTPASIPTSAFTVVTSVDDLADVYRQPGQLVLDKKRHGLDEQSRAFLGLSPFLLLATVGADGGADVSPRGGAPGFAQVIDDGDANYVVVPDLNGNNLIDSIRGIIATGRAGMLVVVPGKDETLRVNGSAWVTTDPSVLSRFSEVRTPKSAIVVRADEVFVHCAKAFRRGRVWDPTSWDELAAAPGIEHIVCAQGLLQGVAPGLIRDDLEAGYAADLAADRPE